MLPFSGLDVQASIAQITSQEGKCPICGYVFSDYSECIQDPATGAFLDNRCLQLLAFAQQASVVAGSGLAQSDVLLAANQYVLAEPATPASPSAS